MHLCWNFEKIGEEGNRHRYRVKGSTEAGTTIDFLSEPDRRQGSWTIAEGIIHHGAFAVPDMEVQARIKFEPEGVGFTDFSERRPAARRVGQECVSTGKSRGSPYLQQ